jgi:hypothetical protein
MNSDGTQWAVEIQGDESSLSRLTQEFECFKRGRQQEVLFYSAAFDDLADTAAVQHAAHPQVAGYAGLVRLLLGPHVVIRLGAVQRHRPNGSREVFSAAEPAVYVTDFTDAPGTHRHSSGDEVPRAEPLSRLVTLMQYAQANPKAHTILRLLNAPDRGAWTGLYKLREAIQDEVGGDAAFSAAGLSSKTQKTRFDRTANSSVAAGDGARHAGSKQDPPPNPMTLEEGRQFIDAVLKAWCDFRGI